MSDRFSSNKTSNRRSNANDGKSDPSTAHGYICPTCQRPARPGELICKYCGKYLVESARSDLVDTNVLSDISAATFLCPACQHACKPGDPMCLNCGKLFVEDKDTNELDQKVLNEPFVHGPTGEISVDDKQAIILEIDGQHLALPIASSVVLGRVPLPLDANDSRPHIDLTDCDAHAKGVSRQHAVILRKHGLVYVADLGSSNGTMLNGTMLAPYSDRVMRSGDELRLGCLTVQIIFPSKAGVHRRTQNSASQ